VKRSGATEGRATTFSRGIDIPRTLLQRHLEFIHRIQFVHMPDDVLHFPFAVDFPRDAFERIHDFGVDPRVHILDDFIVMVVMRIHIQGLLGLRCELFLALGDGDDVAVIFVFEGVVRFGFPVRETFNHPELIAENILDGDESENEEYA
jgi:hypothetical protein